MTYLTITECLMLESDKHRLRGDFYCLLGKHGYAAGSYAKMMKKLKRVQEIQSVHNFWGLPG